jgi:hypothetical protein
MDHSGQIHLSLIDARVAFPLNTRFLKLRGAWTLEIFVGVQKDNGWHARGNVNRIVDALASISSEKVAVTLAVAGGGGET